MALLKPVTHWGWVTRIYVRSLTISGSDYCLSPSRHQAIFWTNAGILFMKRLGNNLQWNLNLNLYIFIQENAFENVVNVLSTDDEIATQAKFAFT